jgi:hypothetical protein
MFKRNGGPGGDLGAYLRSGGDPSAWLNGIWTSLPGGKEPNGATSGFATRLRQFNAREGDAIPSPSVGVPGAQSMRLPSVWDNQMAGGGSKLAMAGPSFSFGPMTINTAATDAKGIARDLQAQIQRKLFTSNFNSGLV